MRRTLLGILTFLLVCSTASCTRHPVTDPSPQAEDPFTYPFVRQTHVKRTPGAPYSRYKALYLVTEDFEPEEKSAEEIREISGILRFSSDLGARYGVPWTHFVLASSLAPAFVSKDADTRAAGADLVEAMRSALRGGDDCELHVHHAPDAEFMEYLKTSGIAPKETDERLRVRDSFLRDLPGYRQRKSFFFSAFDLAGYKELVYRLVCGKRFLERALYDDREQVTAFRPGAFDAGSTEDDVYVFYTALKAAGFAANSGLTAGTIGTPGFHVGNSPGKNVADVASGDGSIFEISPTSCPGGAINPVVSEDYEALANAGAPDEIPVIVSVFHLNHLQRGYVYNRDAGDPEQQRAKVDETRERLEAHFREVAALRDRKVLYPVTIRELMGILSEQH